MDTFNNREIASFIWLTIFLGWAFFKSGEVRRSTLATVKCLWQIKVLSPFLIMAVYMTGVIALLRKIEYWEISLLKDSIIWFFASACVLAMSIVTSYENEGFLFKRIVINSLKLIIIFEFIVNFYTFPLWGELIFLPIVTFITCADVLIKDKEEYVQVKKILNGINVVMGTVVLVYVTYKTIHDYQELEKTETIKSFFLAPILTFCLYPFIYILALFSAYESLFCRLDWSLKGKSVKQYAKWRLLIYCKLNLKRVKQISYRGVYNMMNIETKSDVDTMIKKYCQIEQSSSISAEQEDDPIT